MAIVMTYDSPDIPGSGQYNYLAELRYGSNGDWGGPLDVFAGTPNRQDGENVEWDGDPSDGFNPAPMFVTLSFQSGASGLDWQVKSGPQDHEATTDVTDPVGAFKGINEVDILAGVEGQSAMVWSNIYVAFYKGGALTESVSLGSLGADATNIPGGAAEGQAARIIPTSLNNDRVIVTANVVMKAPVGEYPDPDGMFSQVLIHTA